MNWLPMLAMPTLADPTAADQQVGVWGGVIVLALVVGTVLLWLNMRKQIRKVDVPADHEGESDAGSDAESDAGGVDAEQPKGKSAE